MAEVSEASTEAPKLSDWARFKQVGKYHGIAFLGALTFWGAADAWANESNLLIANLVALANAIIAGWVLSVQFHEWGHFAGARLSRSYSPMVRKPVNAFIFGFIFEKNTREQFLAMSIGGPVGNWLLVLLVLVFVPFDAWSRAMLFAVVTAHAISVSVFEVPIILRTLRGDEPREALDEGLRNGSQARGRLIGYGAGAVLFLLTV